MIFYGAYSVRLRFGMKNNNLTSIYAVVAIDALAFSISGIFVPIFLLSSGATVREVAFYFIAHNVVLLLGAFASGFIASKIGLKKTILIRYPFLFVFLGLLVYWTKFQNPITILATVGGLQAAFFWIPLNIFFGRHSRIRELGSAIAKLNTVP